MDLGDVADSLAASVRRQWEDEDRLHRLNDPYPLPVAWEPTEPELLEDWDFLAVAGNGLPRIPPLSRVSEMADPARLGGCDDELVDVLMHRVPTHRLIVLGEPGAGKTMLLVRLVLDLLANRSTGGSVPILVSLASWNPLAEGLHEWLATRLVIDYPGLRELAPAIHGDVSRVEALLGGQMILPILDGFDEIPETLRGPAISRINQSLRPGEGIVLTSRIAEFRATVVPTDGLPAKVRGAAGITLRPLEATAVETYLRCDAGSSIAAARWDPVLARLGSSEPIAEVMRTPLMVGLARTIYNPRPGELSGALPDPGDLCDTEHFPTRSAIEQHLFDAIISAAYRSGTSTDRPCRWKPERAVRGLSFLARYMEDNLAGTTDLAWWDMTDAAPRWLAGTIVGAICGVAAGLTTGLNEKLGLGVGSGLLAGLLTASALRGKGRRVGTPGGRLAAGGVGGITGAFLGGVAGILGIGGLAGSLTGGVAGGIAVGLAIGPLCDIRGGLIGGLVGGFVNAAMAGFAHGRPVAALVNGAAVGLAMGLDVAVDRRNEPAQGTKWSPVGLIPGLPIGVALGVGVGVRTTAFIGLITALVAAMGAALVSGLRPDEADLTQAVSPNDVLARDRRTFWTVAVVGAFAAPAGLAGGLAVVPNGWTWAAGMAATCALIVSLRLGFVQAALGPFTLTRLWLSTQRRVPFRFMAFLDDAHRERHLLRRVGAVYQFRHVELQRRLAQRDLVEFHGRRPARPSFQPTSRMLSWARSQ